MNKYLEIYDRIPTETEIKDLQEVFSKPCVSTSWEDYFWAGKCIAEYDTGVFKAELLSGMMNNAIKYGLSFRNNREYYLEAIKILASVYGITGQYQLVCNCLGSILELDEDTPDWVYHDFVAAQNRTSEIKRNLRRPKRFLEDLAQNDDNKSETKKKQINIFKEFLSAGIIYLSKYPEADVDITTIKKAAQKYNLTSSAEMKTFLDACEGKISSTIKDKTEYVECDEYIFTTDEQKIDSDFSIRKRPLVISLFSEDEDKVDVDQAFQDISLKLENAQAELNAKIKELEKAGSAVEKLTRANDNLRATVDKYQRDINEYENRVEDKQKFIEELQYQIQNDKKGTKEKHVLEIQLSEAIRQKSEIKEKVDDLKKALEESEERFEIAQRSIIEKESENQELREKLQVKSDIHTMFSSNLSACICGICKGFEFVLTGKLAEWLNKQLSHYNGWWERCVLPALTNDQTLKVQQFHYTSLKDFDLAALLRIFQKNWNRILGHRFLPESDYQCLCAMKEVRNKLAHLDAHPVQQDEIIQVLDTMSEFLLIIGAKNERKEIETYAKEIRNMKVSK